MTLLPWSHESSAGFTLRGWHTPPSGKPLLHFIHGNGFCTRTYEPMLEKLAGHFDHWLCDMQGHGDSDHGGAFRGWEEEARRAHVRHALREEPGQGVTLKCLPEREAEIFESSPHGLWRALSRIAIPVRLIHGDQTYPFVRQSALQLAGRNPMVTVESLPGGHCFMQENSALAAERVRAFLLEG